MRTTLIRTALVATAGLALVPLASADWRFGGSRASIMGGAGLALPYGVSENIRMNPAFRGLTTRTAFNAGSFFFELEGVTFSQLRDYLKSAQSGAISDDKLAEFGRTLGGRNTRFGMGFDGGLSMRNFSVTLAGQATVLGMPDAGLRAWVNSGMAGNPPAGTSIDAYGLTYGALELGFGQQMPATEARLALGAVVKLVQAYYAHKMATYDGAGGATVTNGTDIPAGSDSLNKRGMGIDVGAVYSPTSLPNTHFGAVIENLVEPNVKFTRQLPDGSAMTDTVNPFRRSISIGVGQSLQDGKLLVAADVLDLQNNAGNRALAIGGMYNATNKLGFGLGYNTRYGFTAGFSVYGFNISFSKSAPVSAGYQFRF